MFDGGVASLVKNINRRRRPIHSNVFHHSASTEDTDVEVAMQYTEGQSENLMSYANCINTHEGGTHLTGFRAALTRSLNEYARKSGLITEAQANLSGEDVREGLTAVVSVKLGEPQFEGQTKTKLGNTETRSAVETTLNEGLALFLQDNPQTCPASSATARSGTRRNPSSTSWRASPPGARPRWAGTPASRRSCR